MIWFSVFFVYNFGGWGLRLCVVVAMTMGVGGSGWWQWVWVWFVVGFEEIHVEKKGGRERERENKKN